MNKITREDYMNNTYTHEEYYAQFYSKELENMLLRSISLDEIKNSKDEHFNDIELYRWDSLPFPSETIKALRDSGDVNANTLGNKVCVYKAIARRLKTNNN